MASEFRGDFISLASAGRLINPVDNLDDMVLPDDRTAIVREFAVILNGIQEQLQNTVIIIHFTNTDAVALILAHKAYLFRAGNLTVGRYHNDRVIRTRHIQMDYALGTVKGKSP